MVSCGGEDDDNCPEYSPLPSTFEINGSIKNEKGESIEGIEVEISGKELKTETDSEGKFLFEGILSGINSDEIAVVVKDKENVYEEKETIVTVVKTKDAEYEGKCSKPVLGAHYQADNVVIEISKNKIAEEADSILKTAQIGNNSIAITFSDESVL